MSKFVWCTLFDHSENLLNIIIAVWTFDTHMCCQLLNFRLEQFYPFNNDCFDLLDTVGPLLIFVVHYDCRKTFRHFCDANSTTFRYRNFTLMKTFVLICWIVLDHSKNLLNIIIAVRALTLLCYQQYNFTLAKFNPFEKCPAWFVRPLWVHPENLWILFGRYIF